MKMVFDFNLVTYFIFCSCLSGIYADISHVTGGNGDVSQIWKELNELKAVLLETKLDLSNTRKELADTTETLIDTRQDLQETKRELNEIKRVAYKNIRQFDEMQKSKF